MDRKIIEVRDTKLRGMKDSLEMAPSRGLRGHVEIYEKKNGHLEKIQENHNLIVFGGRNWLLQRAFGANLTDHNDIVYNKTLSWFAVGTGGGEPGNPLQAGAVKGNDTQLISHIALRTYVDRVAHPQFSRRYCRKPELAGADGDNNFYYKKFSSVIVKEDVSNPYMDEHGSTVYPPIVAEVRIELSSQDACTDGEYTDLNEAALYASSFTEDIDLSPDSTNTFNADSTRDICSGIPVGNIKAHGDKYIEYKVFNNYSYEDADHMIHRFTDVKVGDVVYVTGSPRDSINEYNKSLIIDVDKTSTDFSFTVERANGVDELHDFDPEHPELAEVKAYILRGGYEPFTMFSRVSFSTIRKTTDREIVFLWKVYF